MSKEYIYSDALIACINQYDGSSYTTKAGKRLIKFRIRNDSMQDRSKDFIECNTIAQGLRNEICTKLLATPEWAKLKELLPAESVYYQEISRARYQDAPTRTGITWAIEEAYTRNGLASSSDSYDVYFDITPIIKAQAAECVECTTVLFVGVLALFAAFMFFMSH